MTTRQNRYFTHRWGTRHHVPQAIPSPLTLATLAIYLCCCSYRLSGEPLTFERQASISKASPHKIVRLLNGDYVIAGSNSSENNVAWAIRVDRLGHKRWEWTDGTANFSQKGNRVYSVVTMRDDSSLLCGIRLLNKNPTAFLVRIDVSGKVIDDRNLAFRVPGGTLTTVLCEPWGSGVALLGRIGTDSGGVGWLAKLDGEAQLVWEKYDAVLSATDSLETADHNLLIANTNASDVAIFKIDSNGHVISRRRIAGSTAKFLKPLLSSPRIRVGIMSNDLQTKFYSFNRDFTGPTSEIDVNNVGIEKGFELADGTLIVFGSTYISGATASVVRIGTDSKSYVVEPLHESYWINDAVPGDLPNEYVTIRSLSNGQAVIGWILLK